MTLQKEKNYKKRIREIFILITSFMMFISPNIIIPVTATTTTTTDWKYPGTVTDSSWINQNNIKANDGSYAYSSSTGPGNYIQGTNYASNFPSEKRAISKVSMKVEVKRNGRSFQADPKIKIGYNLAGAWHWTGTYTVTRSWVLKTANFFPSYVLGNPKDIQIRVYIYSNPDGVLVQIDYLQCQVRYISDPEDTYSPGNFGGDWGRHPTNGDVLTEANTIIFNSVGNDPNINASAYALWNYVINEFEWTTPAIRKDYDAIDDYKGRCYTAAILLTGLCRASGIPARTVLFSFDYDGVEHAFVEIYVGDDYDGGDYSGWIPADADPFTTGGFFGWSEYQDFAGTNWYWIPAPEQPRWNVVDNIIWVYDITGDEVDGNDEWKLNDTAGYYGDGHSDWDTYSDLKAPIDS
ncbi:MAG: transglutaminase-like domain-containing protein [Candidatus Hodarchaeales archaeon]|jgi:transglutaminase-like putative cysteine protease